MLLHVIFCMKYIAYIYSCVIDWKKGKNVTVKKIRKKQKHSGRGTTRTVTKTVQNDSFFNFFSPPAGWFKYYAPFEESNVFVPKCK